MQYNSTAHSKMKFKSTTVSHTQQYNLWAVHSPHALFFIINAIRFPCNTTELGSVVLFIDSGSWYIKRAGMNSAKM